MSIFKKENNSPASSDRPFVTAVIVAAGNSTRMGGVNKQFLLIDGVPVRIRSLLAFAECDYINEIVGESRISSPVDYSCERTGRDRQDKDDYKLKIHYNY